MMTDISSTRASLRMTTASPDTWLPLALTLLDLCRAAEWSGRMEYPSDAPGFAIGGGLGSRSRLRRATAQA